MCLAGGVMVCEGGDVCVFVQRGCGAGLLGGMGCVFGGNIVCVKYRPTSSVMVFEGRMAS